MESPVNVESFNRALDLIKNDEKIGYIGLKYNRSYDFKETGKITSEEPFLNKDDLITCNRVNSMTALWRKDWLISLLRMHETPWDFEKYGSVRSRRTDKKVLIINNHVLEPVFHYEVDVEYGMGIYGGKWLENNKILFEKHGIKVDYDNLGLYQKTLSLENVTNGEEVKPLRERLYTVKHFFKVQKRKLKRLVRKIRSLV